MKNLLGYPKMLEEAKTSKKPHSWIIELLIFVLVYIVTSRASSVPTAIGTIIWIFSGNWPAISSGVFDSSMDGILALMEALPSWLKIISLFATGITTIFAILYCKEEEKRTAASMGFRKNHIGREYILGAAIGLLMISAATVIGLVTGAYCLSWAAPSPVLLILFLLGYMVQGMSEETLCRGYLMVSMTRKTPVWICIVLSALVFAALHLFNPGISVLAFLNLFLFGVITAVYIIKRGSIWGACALHSFWNYYQGCVYGISVSGTGAAEGSVYSVSQIANADVLWTGGTFGIEGGLCTTIVVVIVLLLVLFVLPKVKDEQYVPDVPAQETDSAQAPEAGLASEAVPVSEPVSESAPESVPAPETMPAPEADQVPEAAPVPVADSEVSPAGATDPADISSAETMEKPPVSGPSVLPEDSTQSWS